MKNVEWKMTSVLVRSTKSPCATRVKVSQEKPAVFGKTNRQKAEKAMRRVNFVGICLALLLWFAVTSAGVATAQSETSRLPAKQAEQVIAGRSRQVMLALKSRNLARLSSLVHPRKGLRFSPYHSVNFDPGGDLVFKRSQVKGLGGSKKRYHWGDDDGSGDPIRLTYASYHRKFVYDHDYLTAKQITYNSENLTSGNLINNIRQSYPAAIIVEYHFPGFEEKYGGMDWKSVWLVFEKDGTEWYLVGIAHGEWTI
jgi:hypothetical protein